MTTAAHAGTDLSSLKTLHDRLQLDWEEIADIVGVNPSTLHRWRTGESRPRPMAWSRLALLDELLQVLPRVFAGPDLARTWIRTATPAGLGSQETPISVMRKGRVDRVVNLLQFLARGA